MLEGEQIYLAEEDIISGDISVAQQLLCFMEKQGTILVFAALFRRYLNIRPSVDFRFVRVFLMSPSQHRPTTLDFAPI